MVLAQVHEPTPAPWPSTQLIPPPPPPVYAYQQPAIYPNNAFSPPLAGSVQSNNQFHITVSPPASPDARRTSGSWSTADDPYKSYHAAHRPHQQPVVQPNNVFPSPAPIQSDNRLHRTSIHWVPHPLLRLQKHDVRAFSHWQPVVQSDNTLPTPTPVQSNNPFLRYLVAENVSPPVSSEAQRETSQADSDPYDTHAVARRQQAAALAKYSRNSDSNQLSGSGASSIVHCATAVHQERDDIQLCYLIKKSSLMLGGFEPCAMVPADMSLRFTKFGAYHRRTLEHIVTVGLVSVTLPNDIKIQMSIMGKALGKAALDRYSLLSRSADDTKEWRLLFEANSKPQFFRIADQPLSKYHWKGTIDIQIRT
ncbi:hypothetical protein EV421DRAFT_1729756 [Armillaria borealis]|uniref:Uncharacterized protein n=1 Tax=Armillaria borealis TaxID=47425 RepID=A0AA39K4X5_9AGAR|nr:hypothetical protein EV421DRAFT_1729756 [Armillaria borealis]